MTTHCTWQEIIRHSFYFKEIWKFRRSYSILIFISLFFIPDSSEGAHTLFCFHLSSPFRPLFTASSQKRRIKLMLCCNFASGQWQGFLREQNKHLFGGIAIRRIRRSIIITKELFSHWFTLIKWFQLMKNSCSYFWLFLGHDLYFIFIQLVLPV